MFKIVTPIQIVTLYVDACLFFSEVHCVWEESSKDIFLFHSVTHRFVLENGTVEEINSYVAV